MFQLPKQAIEGAAPQEGSGTSYTGYVLIDTHTATTCTSAIERCADNVEAATTRYTGQ